MIPIKNRQKKTSELFLYGEIGDWGISDSSVASQLKSFGRTDEINVRISSIGGDYMQGMAIYNLLRDQKAIVNTQIDGGAYSISSVIAMAGEERKMSDNVLFMMHKPWGVTVGDEDDHLKAAQTLSKVKDNILNAYFDRSKINRQTLTQLVDDETWLNADEALDLKLITEIVDRIDDPIIVDSENVSFNYKNMPDEVKPKNLTLTKYQKRVQLMRHAVQANRIKRKSELRL